MIILETPAGYKKRDLANLKGIVRWLAEAIVNAVSGLVQSAWFS